MAREMEISYADFCFLFFAFGILKCDQRNFDNGSVLSQSRNTVIIYQKNEERIIRAER